MSQQQSDHATMLRVRRDQPLIAIPVIEDGEEVTYYFVDEKTAGDFMAQRGMDARSLAGAWSDLDWEETVEALDRIRHESKPTPPIEDLV
jgi:hypothetical protein